MKRVIVAGLALLAAAAGAAAHGGGHESAPTRLRLAAREGAACTGEASMCFTVEEGSLDEVKPGKLLRLELENEGTVGHNVAVGGLSEAHQAGRDTPVSAAVASTPTVEPGGNATVLVRAPSDPSGAYLWCHVAGHEAMGMWIEVPYENASQPAAHDGPQGATSDRERRLGVVAAAGAVGGAAAALLVERGVEWARG